MEYVLQHLALLSPGAWVCTPPHPVQGEASALLGRECLGPGARPLSSKASLGHQVIAQGCRSALDLESTGFESQLCGCLSVYLAQGASVISSVKRRAQCLPHRAVRRVK